MTKENIYSYESLAYIDTNVLSQLAKKIRDKKISDVMEFRQYLIDNKLCIAISETHMLELSDAYKLGESLAILLLILPSALLISREMILEKEVNIYPSRFKESIVAIPLNPLLLQSPKPFNLLKEHLFSKQQVIAARKEQKNQAAEMYQINQRQKSNFPNAKTGKFEKYQAKMFADIMLYEALASLHRKFFLSFKKEDINTLKTSNFQGVQLRAMAIFYKYYLQNRQPKNTSDLGDFSHLYYLPYCKLVILEKDLCNILNQITNEYDILPSTAIEDISFVRNFVPNL